MTELNNQTVVGTSKDETTTSNPPDIQVAFLGICERAAYVREGLTNLFKWNILGLKQVVLSHIFPLRLSGLRLVFAFFGTNVIKQHHFELTDEFGKQIGTIDIAAEISSDDVTDISAKPDVSKLLALRDGWTTMILPLGDTNITIERPGQYYVRLLSEENQKTVGELQFAVIDPLPLSADQIAAIRSDPNAAKAVRYELGCRFCPVKCRAYAAIERSEKIEADGWAWYKDLPDSFLCGCGRTNLDLTILRRNLHCVLGQRRRNEEMLSFIPLYEKSSLEALRFDFAKLIASCENEEQLQKFIEQNPVLLHQFPAERLFPKPKILTFFTADFGIITPQKELLLIELEKPTTRLLRKDGGTAADLVHAFDQVESWLRVVEEHRLSVIDSLGIDKKEVGMVRGIVIAGRNLGYDLNKLKKLKSVDRGKITFLTYDDLTDALDALIRKFDTL